MKNKELIDVLVDVREVVVNMNNKELIDALEGAIQYAEEAINEIQNKAMTTYNEDRRKKLAEQFIAKVEKLIKELKDEKN